MSAQQSQPPSAGSSSGKIVVCKACDVGKKDTGQSKGMVRKAALTGVNPNICSSMMTSEPNSTSDIHYHPQDTIVYSVRGRGAILYGPNAQDRHEIAPGDHALIPAYAEHQEANTGDEEVEWVIVRNGFEPGTVNLPEGWGSSKNKAKAD